MTIRVRTVLVGGSGEEVITLPPCRVVAIDTGTTLMARGTSMAAGDRLPPQEEFAEGTCYMKASPGATARAFFRF